MDKVGLYMNEKVYQIAPEDTVLKAAQTLVKHGCRSLLVKGKYDFSGIVTEGDITRRVVAKGLDTREVPVQGIMSSPIVTVEHDDLMPQVFILMQTKNFRHLPVRFQGKIVGMLSVSDFLKYFMARFGMDAKDRPNP